MVYKLIINYNYRWPKLVWTINKNKSTLDPFFCHYVLRTVGSNLTSFPRPYSDLEFIRISKSLWVPWVSWIFVASCTKRSNIVLELLTFHILISGDGPSWWYSCRCLAMTPCLLALCDLIRLCRLVPDWPRYLDLGLLAPAVTCTCCGLLDLLGWGSQSRQEIW